MSPKQAPGDLWGAAYHADSVQIYAHLSISPLDSDADGPFRGKFSRVIVVTVDTCEPARLTLAAVLNGRGSTRIRPTDSHQPSHFHLEGGLRLRQVCLEID